jgi:NADH-quinone oxidoreductase subunit F
LIKESFYKRLQNRAKLEFAVKADKYRVVVQLGHCSSSLGANDVVKSFADYLTSDAYMVVAGCDGACFNGPKVSVISPDGSAVSLEKVDASTAVRIATLIEGKMSPLKFTVDANDFIEKQTRVLLKTCGDVDAVNLSEYVSNEGYYGLFNAVSLEPDKVIDRVKNSGLRGRGGAYFPTALKWQGARKAKGVNKYIVVNSEEGEPGVFKDRHLMEGVPHKIIEGALIAAYAVGAENIFFYINAEAHLSYERMNSAIKEIISAGILKDGIMGSKWPAKIELRRGAGGYVCGEETTLLNTMEGYRREPRLRPPFPTESGYLASPTIINNAETLANLPQIFANPVSDFTAIGGDTQTGTKLISLSGAVHRTGLAEVPFGTTLKYLIHDIGGGLPPSKSLKAIGIGGPSSGLLPPSLIDTKISPGILNDGGIILGAGGVIVLDDSIAIIDSIKHLADYNADESCGKCTPCREGTPKLVELIDKFIAKNATDDDLKELQTLATIIKDSSLCGLGQAAGNPVFSLIRFFNDQLLTKAN